MLSEGSPRAVGQHTDCYWNASELTRTDLRLLQECPELVQTAHDLPFITVETRRTLSTRFAKF